MNRIREDVNLHATPHDVHARLAALDTLGEWLPPQFSAVPSADGELWFELAMPLRRERARLAVAEDEPPWLLALTHADGVDGRTLTALTWALHAESPREVHLTLEAEYEPAAGVLGSLLEPVLYEPLRRQAFRDALWRLKHVVEAAGLRVAERPAKAESGRPTPSRVQALIFDLDGVLVDTEPVHLAATRALIAPHELSMEQYETFIGRGGFKQWLHETYAIPIPEIDARYGGLFFAEIEREPVRPLPGAVELIEAARSRGVPVALASQSSRGWVEATLASAGLTQHFPIVVTAEEVGVDKPAPDIYLHTAKALDVDPAYCIAIEDSVHGIASAHAAGMRVVQSRQASFAPAPQPGAGAVVDSLLDFDPRWLDGEPLA